MWGYFFSFSGFCFDGSFGLWVRVNVRRYVGFYIFVGSFVGNFCRVSVRIGSGGSC